MTKRVIYCPICNAHHDLVTFKIAPKSYDEPWIAEIVHSTGSLLGGKGETLEEAISDLVFRMNKKAARLKALELTKLGKES